VTTDIRKVVTTKWLKGKLRGVVTADGRKVVTTE